MGAPPYPLMRRAEIALRSPSTTPKVLIAIAASFSGRGGIGPPAHAVYRSLLDGVSPMGADPRRRAIYDARRPILTHGVSAYHLWRFFFFFNGAYIGALGNIPACVTPRLISASYGSWVRCGYFLLYALRVVCIIS